MNATQSSPSLPREVSVITPVSQALDHVKHVLFQPFDVGKWFLIGFTAWLAQLGERGVTSFNTGGGRGKNGGSLGHELDQARDYVMNNLYWIIPVAIGVVLLLLSLWLLFTWLNSRGKFMFLHCVALNKAEVAVPWRKFATQGNSLFWFRIVLGLIGTLVMLPLIVLGVFIGIGMFAHGKPALAGVLILIAVALVFLGLALAFGLVSKLTTDFVVPIMFVRGGRCLDGWKLLWSLITGNLVNILLYLLFQMVLGLAIGLAVLLVALVTCCVCGLLLIPYLGTVLLLPVYVFTRAYSAIYLAQYGKEFDAFAGAIRA